MEKVESDEHNHMSVTVIENKTFDEERALYGSKNVTAIRCRFDGPADGESAFKESQNIRAEGCYFNLRYPFWHDFDVCIADSELTAQCRAPLWYTENIVIHDTAMHGVKALRECKNVQLSACDIVSPEFGWFSSKIRMEQCRAEGEYFLLRASDIYAEKTELKGKYSFQYISEAVFENCRLDTKDAFWHARNVVVRNSVVTGEYLAWYCENVVFENCVISGTQPFCYCKNLKLIDCEMHGADLAFEKSYVEAKITTPVISIKNPSAGSIRVPSVGEIIRDDPASAADIFVD